MLKQIIKNILSALKLDLTKNLEYDRLTKEVIKKAVNLNSVCVDVGCHKGEILDLIFSQSNQKHYAFEPIPEMNQNLKRVYGDRIHLFDCALSNEEGETTFNHVKNAPAYSGIKERSYNVDKPDIEKINVKLQQLDNILEEQVKIDFIKIDVEGAEFEVIVGFKDILQKHRPNLLVEILPVYESSSPRVGRQQAIEEILDELGYYKYRILKDENNNFSSFEKIKLIGVHDRLDWCDYLFSPNAIGLNTN